LSHFATVCALYYTNTDIEKLSAFLHFLFILMQILIGLFSLGSAEADAV